MRRSMRPTTPLNLCSLSRSEVTVAIRRQASGDDWVLTTVLRRGESQGDSGVGTALSELLDMQRDALINKLKGLSDEQARRAPCVWPDMADRNLRWVTLHMIEEAASHADIIRETFDGTRGA